METWNKEIIERTRRAFNSARELESKLSKMSRDLYEIKKEMYYVKEMLNSPATKRKRKVAVNED